MSVITEPLQIAIFGCPACGDVYFGCRPDERFEGGDPSPCCGERLMAGSIEAGTAYTPRKLCEELREVNVGTDDDGNFNPSVVPELQRFARWLNVIVVSDVVRYTMEPDRLVSEHVSLAALDPLIWFPLGTRVYVETLLPGDAIVHGYVVKPQQDMSWDVVSPRCAGCGKPTEYGAECSIVEREGKRVIMGVCCEDGITP